MNNTFTNNKLTNLKSEKLDWKIIETDMKNKLNLGLCKLYQLLKISLTKKIFMY